MSLYTFLVEKDKVYIGADSRQGMFIDGEYQVVKDNTMKVFAYDNFIYTFGGTIWVCNYMNNLIKTLAENAEWALNMEIISQLFKYVCTNRSAILKSLNLDDEILHQALSIDIAVLGEMLAVKYDKEKAIYDFYTVSSRDNFKLERFNVADNNSKDLFICGGFNNEVASKAWDKYRNFYKNDMKGLFTKVYEAAADEYVGGTLHYIEAEKGRITKRQAINIKDSKFVKRVNKNSCFLAHNIVGKNLFIKATTADEKMMTFRVDGKGVLLDNGNFTLKNMNNKGDGNNVNMDFERGIVVTQNDAKTRVIINAIDGLCIQKGNGQGTPEDALDSEHWTDKPVKINTDGDAVFGGDIHAKRLFLQELGGENIITYIDKDKNSYKNSSTYKSDADEVKLSGEYLEGRGLKAYDRYNNLRVKIDGNDGSLSIYNGYINLKSGNNEINIDADGGILFTKNGETVLLMDINDGSLYIGGDATFAGTIDTGEDCIVGANLTVGRVTESPEIHLEGMMGDICTIACDGSGDKSTTINSAGHLILKSSLGAYLGSANNKDNKLVTQNDLKNILLRLDQIETAINSLL